MGKEADVTIIRDRSREQIKVMIAELPTMTKAAYTPEEEEKPQENTALGMSVTELSKSVQKKLKVQAGVEVTDVEEVGSARDAGVPGVTCGVAAGPRELSTRARHSEADGAEQECRTHKYRFGRSTSRPS